MTSISAVVVHFRGDDHLDRCVRSCLSVSAVTEVIVVDNEGVADELRRRQEDGRVKVLAMDRNVGYGAAANAGLDVATGEAVLVLNQDTVLDGAAVSAMLEASTISGGWLIGPQLVDADGHAATPRTAFPPPLVWPGPSEGGDGWRTVAYLLGACLLFAPGHTDLRFDPRLFMYAEDEELGWRIWAAGGRTVLATSARVLHLGGTATTARWSRRSIALRTIWGRTRLVRWHGGGLAAVRSLADAVAQRAVRRVGRVRGSSRPPRRQPGIPIGGRRARRGLRIAYLVHQYLPDHVGGAEVYTHGLARRARDSGHDVLIVTGVEWPTAKPAEFVPMLRRHDGIDVVDIPYNLATAPVVARFEYDNPFTGTQVETLLERWAPDVVHVTHPMKLSASTLDVCAAHGIPVVVTLADFWFVCPRHTLLTWDGRLCQGPTDPDECMRCVVDLHGVVDRAAERRAVRDRAAALRLALTRADKVLALSPFLKRMFVANGYDSDRIEVLPHGLETADFTTVPPMRTDDGPIRITVVGSVVRHKGLHILLAALQAEPSLADVEVRIYGRPSSEDPYGQQLLAATADDPRVVWAGTFPPGELGRVVAEADYLALPAIWYENEPLVVKAALHLGVPVIVSRIGSLEDMVEDGVDGWLVPPGDIAAWASALRRAAAAGRQLTRRPRPQPDMELHFARVATIYENLAAVAAAAGSRP